MLDRGTVVKGYSIEGMLGRGGMGTVGTGFDHELLLRVGVLPGGQPRAPSQVTGSAAANRSAGRVRRRVRESLGDGTIDIALVEVDRSFALDEFVGGRRVARMGIPGMAPGAKVIRFVAAPWSPDEVGLDVSYVNDESARVIQRSYVVRANGFQLLR